VLGEPSVRLLHEALALVFSEVVESPRPASGPGLRSDLAGVIEPRIISAGFQWSRSFPTHVTYGFTLYSPGGEPVASWAVTGSNSEPIANPLAAVSALRGKFEQAMREAAWKLTSGFRDIPEVRRWLDEQGVR